MSEEEVISREILVEGIANAPVGIAIFSVPDLTFKMANAVYLDMINRQRESITGQPLFDVLPEARGPLEAAISQVITLKTVQSIEEIESRVARQGRLESLYFNYICQPVINRNGNLESVMLFALNVTDIVRGRRKLQQDEEKFRAMVSRSPIGMAILRGKDLIVEVPNHAILGQFWGRSLPEVQGKKLFDVLPELANQTFAEIVTCTFDTGKEYRQEELPVYIEGSPCNYIDLEITPLPADDRSCSGLLLSVYDVTEKVRIRKRIKENEERLRMVVDASGLGNWEINLKTGEVTFSQECLATFGVSEHLSYLELLKFIHPDDLPTRDKAYAEAFATGRLHYIARLLWRDKSIHWIEVHGKVLYDDQKRPFKMIGATRDITEERLHQQAIRESEAKFRLLADSMPQFIWTCDSEGNVSYLNNAVFLFTGMNLDALKGQGWLDVIHPEDREENLRAWREAVESRGNYLFEHRFRRYDGSFRWQLSRATPQFDTEGKIQMWVGSSMDIHDQKTFARELEDKVLERTRELKESNEALEKTNRELEQFAYIASHDLQEPLRKIMTFSDILKRNIHDEKAAQKYFSKIDTSARRMGDLIRAVLDYSRLPTHPSQLMLVDLNDVFENVKTDLELTIAEKAARVECDHLPAVPGIPLQIQQLFSNLLGNALKFCISDPVVKVSFRAVPGSDLTHLFKADELKQYLELSFTDNGIGFDNRYKDQIFTIFQRLHGLQQYSGTGIGLALCKKIVDSHQGYITAQSEPGCGSTFLVYLPA